MDFQIEPVLIDPSALSGFEHDFDDGILKHDCRTEFHHDAAWTEKVCEQIRLHRVALVKLPPRYAALYQHLLQPAVFPSPVKDSDVSLAVKKSRTLLGMDTLPEDLLKVLSAWATVCEHVTKHASQRLRRLVLSRPVDKFAHHEIHGQLRIAINCDTERHNDDSYITLLGLGNMRNTLKLEIGEQWIDAWEFVEAVSTSKSDGPTFLMFGGAKTCSLDGKDYRPLNHVVEFDCYSPPGGHERINATYFVRRYDESDPDATRCTSSAVIQFQHLNRIILQSEMYHRPPRPPVIASEHVCTVPELSNEEEFLTNGNIDWSGDGLALGS